MCSLNHALNLYRDELDEKCTYCGLDRIETHNPLVLVDDKDNEVVCLMCIENERLVY